MDETATTATIIKTARWLRDHGFSILWLRPGEKAPRRKGWQLGSQEPGDYTAGSNLGILCGQLSGNLVCVDLDHAEALARADDFLPATGMVDGRPGKPRSHRWYRVIDIPAALTAGAHCAGGIGGPRSAKFSEKGSHKAVVEFKGTGQQAVVPPSVWTGGDGPETRAWYGQDGQPVAMPGEPATVDCMDLFQAVYRLAMAVSARAAAWVATLLEPRARVHQTRNSQDAPVDPPIVVRPPVPVRATVRNAGVLLLPPTERLDRAQHYLDRAPLARSGHGGHDTTYVIARTLVNDYGLAREDALGLLRQYNDRLRRESEEPWSEAELAHKIDSALAAPANPRFPFGCRVLAEPVTNPHRLAREFLGRNTFRYWRDLYWEYDDRKYVHVPDKEMRALVTRHIAERFREEYEVEVRRYERRLAQWQATQKGGCPQRPAPRPVQAHQVSNVMLALNDQALLRSTYSMPCLLPGGHDHEYLAVANGLLDLNTGELNPHTPDWFSNVCVPYDFDPAAKAPQWEAFLQRNLQGDGERIDLLQEVFGYCLVKTTDGQICLMLFGEGGNGKSVLLAGLRAVLGADNISTVPLEQFAGRFALAQTLGKLANVCPEVGELDKTAEGTIKGYISGDTMFFEKKNKDGFSAAPTARLIVATNNVPRFMDKSEGIWRRLLLMPMNVRIPVTERKVGMDKEAYWIAAGEAPGILNWALAGLRRLRESGWHFTSPAACRAALAEHRLESDPARAFLLERYEVHADAEPLAVNSLYQEYRLYCDTRGHRNPMNDSTFGRQVRRVFPVAHSKVVRCGSEGVQRFWFGLGPAQGGGGVPRGTAAGSPVTALPMPGKPLQEP